MKKHTKLLLILLLIVILVLSPLFAYIKSLSVMSVYSAYEDQTSVMKTYGIDIDMPGGLSTMKKDWYPFVITFNPSTDSFSRRLGRTADVSIMYNFGAFEYIKGASTYYNETSDYFDGFYGAYVVHDHEKIFGFNDDGTVNTDDIGTVSSYDMKVLVLRSIGMKNPRFDHEITDVEYNISLAGYDDWVKVDSILYTNSPVHEVKENQMAYIQYGKPPKAYYEGEDYEPIEMLGRVYIRYFQPEDVTVAYYIIAANKAVLEETDDDFIIPSKITISE